MVKTRTRTRNTPEQIRERRDRIRLLSSRGYSQFEIIHELGITTATYDRDMKNIIEMSRKRLYELAKASPSKIYSDYVNDLDKIKTECLKMYNDPETNPSDKMLVLRTISELNEEINDKNRKLSMFQEDYRP